MANAADIGVLDSGKLDANQLEACLQDIKNLKAFPLVVDIADTADRFALLEMAMRQTPMSFQFVTKEEFKKIDELMLKGEWGRLAAPLLGGSDDFDRDPALRKINQLLDAVCTALRHESRTKRREEPTKLGGEIDQLKEKMLDPKNLGVSIAEAKSSRGFKSQYFADYLVAMTNPPRATRGIQDAADRTEQRNRNLLIAFALAIHYREHGNYPKQLADLAPKYLPKIPDDLFSGKPLIYRPTKTGYLLYSIGPNGVDDQGRGQDDDPPGGDDLAVRIPLAKSKNK
jgi:hypothetical protein